MPQTGPALSPRPSSPTIRTFARVDLEPVVRLIHAEHNLSPEVVERRVLELAEELRLPRADPTHNLLVAEQAGGIVGYAIIDLEINIERAVARVSVEPALRRRGIGSLLLSATVQRAREAGARFLHVAAPDKGAGCSEFLSAVGMHPVRCYWRMRLQVPEGLLAGTPESAPAGYKFRQFEAGRDEVGLTELQNAAFGGSWGFSPNTAGEITARLQLRGQGPEGVIFLERGERPVAYVWTALRGRVGSISMTGVHPDLQGQGLGKAIASAALHNLASRGAGSIDLDVDSANVAAIKLYRHLGFARTAGIQWYEMALGA